MRCDTIKLEKGMYEEGRTFTQVLEELDPSYVYNGTTFEGLDAFQRQLKRFDIRVKGAMSDTVEKFFASSESAVLFPEYVSRAVRRGIEETDISHQIIASATILNDLSEMDENKHTRLHRRGRMLTFSYDAVRRQKLDLVSVVLKQIGLHISNTHLEDAVDVLINGDDDSGSAEVTSVNSCFSRNDISKLQIQLDPYEMNTVLISNEIFKDLCRNSAESELKAIRLSALQDKTVIGLDKRFALEMIQLGDLEVEYEKLIDRKFERAAISTTCGFSKICEDASKVLRVVA